MKTPKLMEEMEKLGFKAYWNNANSLKYDCPECGKKKKFIYYLSECGGNYWCAECNESGNLYNFLIHFCGFSPTDAQMENNKAKDPEFSLHQLMENYQPTKRYEIVDRKLWNRNAIKFHRMTQKTMVNSPIAFNWLKKWLYPSFPTGHRHGMPRYLSNGMPFHTVRNLAGICSGILRSPTVK